MEKLKVCVSPIPEDRLSKAMGRVARALTDWAPTGIEVVEDPSQAELQVLHVIGPGAKQYLEAPDWACIQYCREAPTTEGGANELQDASVAFRELWDGKLVWSYYEMEEDLPSSSHFYLAPLGIDEAFTGKEVNGHPRQEVMSSGFVAGPGAEAIEEFAMAAHQVGIKRINHLGPKGVKGMTSYPMGFKAVNDISDDDLAAIYGRSSWVCAMRHLEGFEMPAIEGMAMGARPICFDRPDMRLWYEDLAAFVPECSGQELVAHLVEVMSTPNPLTPQERMKALVRFNWEPIALGFWHRLMEVTGQ